MSSLPYIRGLGTTPRLPVPPAFVDLAALGAVALAMRAEGRRLRDLFVPFRWVDLAWGALLLVILVVGFLASNFAANLLVHGGAPPVPTDTLPSVPLWVGLVAVLVAPLSIALRRGCSPSWSPPR